MPGTLPTRAVGRAGDMAEDAWEDLPDVAWRNVAGLSDRQIETLIMAVAVGVVAAAVVAGWWSLRRPR